MLVSSLSPASSPSSGAAATEITLHKFPFSKCLLFVVVAYFCFLLLIFLALKLLGRDGLTALEFAALGSVPTVAIGLCCGFCCVRNVCILRIDLKNAQLEVLSYNTACGQQPDVVVMRFADIHDINVVYGEVPNSGRVVIRMQRGEERSFAVYEASMGMRLEQLKEMLIQHVMKQ